MNINAVRVWGGRALIAVVACFVLLLVGAGSTLAQIDTGAVLGTVSDSSGARINGANVTLTNEGTNASVSVTTSEDGLYKFTPVKIGTYKVTVTLQGFQTTTQHGIQVNVGDNVVVDLALKPGSVSETVEVTSSVPVLQSQDASVGQVVDSRSVNDLPLNGRNFTFLAQLAAGVNTPQADTRGNAASGAFAANGNRPAQNNYLLDGIDNNSDTVDFLNGTNFVVLPPVDAIQEFKVQTSGFSAEYGRSGAAVLNATIRSGTNEFHGAAWEFFRNDKLDAADFFENQQGIKKGEYRQNQFGVSAGGPVIKNKIFFFADFEGLRRRQGTILTGSVPTVLERSTFDGHTGFIDLSDMITGQESNGAITLVTDALGRTMPKGTILDPATTRAVTAGTLDPTSGIVAGNSGFVRDPFGTCAASTAAFTLAGCSLNQLPFGRVDANAIKLLSLYPDPNNGNLFSNFASTPKLKEDRNAFDARMDVNFTQNDNLFFRFSLADDPQFIPGIFGGVADGGGFQQGNQTAIAQQSALGYTHTFSPSLINVARVGLNYLHTTRVSPSANDLSNIPGTFGIQGIPQLHENGGLPAFGISGLQTLGSNAFLPSDEVSSTIQLTDDVTKIYQKHTFKMGFEWQHVKFSTLQPPWSRGQFDFNGIYTDIPTTLPGLKNQTNQGNTGRAQFLLIPTTHDPLVSNGIDYVGGPSDGSGNNSVFVSNISLTDNGKNYYGGYINDDWKISNKLTVNLGLRWDYFQPVYEHHAAQANFVPGGPPTGGPAYLLPTGPNTGNLSSGCATCFTDLLAKDGIALVVGKFGKSLAEGQKHNFAPRLGFAYQATPKLIARGGFGIFFNGFENRGFSPNIGENYPFQFNFQYAPPNDGHPIIFTDQAGNPCATAGPIGNATLETGFSCSPLDPLLVNASGLGLRGIQFNYITPYTMSGNFTLQYQVKPSMSVQAAYVTSLARHLEVFPGSNNVTLLLPHGTNLAEQDGGANVGQCPTLNFPGHACLPFPDFGRNNSYAATEGNSFYHALQTRVEKQYANGLNFLFTYTWSKVRSDALDLLNGGSIAPNGYRAPAVPGFGIRGDYALAPFDIRNVFHVSGGYELPFGRGKKFATDASGVTNQLIGGWSVIWSATLQGGQPVTIPCSSSSDAPAGANCNALLVKGQDANRGLHTNLNGFLAMFNASGFAEPAACTTIAGCDVSVLGGGNGQVTGPGFHRLDFSIFKDFAFRERYRLQFRSEIFNILNHPNFNAPGFGGNGVVAISGSTNFTDANFGRIGSTRDAPNDPRQIQFALKFYY